MFMDDRYDYICKSKEYYDQVLEDMKNGLGTIENLTLYLIRYKNDKKNQYIKRVLVPEGEDYLVKDGYEIYSTYSLTKLSYRDPSMIENEVFDLYMIKDIGYYEITDYYKSFSIPMEKDMDLYLKCLEYEKRK